jgi:hypothetical protein
MGSVSGHGFSKFVETVGNRKLQLPFVSGRVGEGFMNGNGIDEMVESVPKIVEGQERPTWMNYQRDSLLFRRRRNGKVFRFCR